jgi:hypothetical protein
MLVLDELLGVRKLPGQQVDRAVDRLRQQRELPERPRNVPTERATSEAVEEAPIAKADIDARLRWLRDRIFGRRAPAAANPLEGLPQLDILHWRRGVEDPMQLRTVDEQLARLAEIIRTSRAGGVPDAVLLRALEWLRRQGRLNDPALAAAERMIFLEAAAAEGAIIMLSPDQLREFDAFAGDAQVTVDFIDLTRLADIRAKVILQAQTGRPMLTNDDLRFIAKHILRRGPDARRMFAFERAETDLDRAELLPLFPEDFIQALRTIHAGRRRPATIDENPAVAPVPARPAPDSPVAMFKTLPLDVQRSLLTQVEHVAQGFDLHRWYRAVKGNAEGERALLAELRRESIGNARGATSVTAEIEARLASVAAPPTGLSLLRVRAEADRALDAWRRAPGDAAAALHWLRLRVLLGAFSHRTAARPFRERIPGPGALSAAEAMQLFGKHESEVTR